MSDTLEDRLARILPGGRGVWIPMDHGTSNYPEQGLQNMDSLIESIIAGGADAIVLQKDLLPITQMLLDGTVLFVMFQHLLCMAETETNTRSMSQLQKSVGSVVPWGSLDRSISAMMLRQR